MSAAVSRLLVVAAFGLLSMVGEAATPRERAVSLMKTMSLSDKIKLLHGTLSSNYTGETQQVPAHGIPSIRMNDGRQGVRNAFHDATAWPSQLALAATFDRDLMFQSGAASGAEFAAKGVTVVLAPMLILARVPQGGRNFESCGEDPQLGYELAFAEIQGIQSNELVLANADDFVLNNQEQNRMNESSVCDERTRFELYYRAYAGAIAANVASFMCSYNRVAGVHACENKETLTDDLRGHLKFDGFVVSDWYGTHSTVASALNGLDIEMPMGVYFSAPVLKAAIAKGSVPEGVVDDKVVRILTQLFRAGIMDKANHGHADANTTSAAHSALARRIATSSTVLLRNEGNALPLINAGLGQIAVFGDDAYVDPICCGTGSGHVTPPFLSTPLDAIKARAPSSVRYAATPRNGSSLTQFFSSVRHDHLCAPSCDECFDLYVRERLEGYTYGATCPWGTTCDELVLYWSATANDNVLSTRAVPPSEPGYTLVRTVAYVPTLSYQGTRATVPLELWVVHQDNGDASNATDHFTLASAASRQEAERAGYTMLTTLARVFSEPYDALDDATHLAQSSSVAVVCVSTASGEGSDRANLSLADADTAMIEAIAAVQPRTIVVLHNPGAVLMPWIDRVPAVIAAWFPGQEMGVALADVLFGDVDPGGRLPLTFPARETDTPVGTPEQYPGVDGIVTYSERLLIGYRWFDAKHVVPLFPFGHGLSYTTFVYRELAVERASPLAVRVGCTVVNQGTSRQGTTVAQLYIAFPATAEMPPWQLRNFTRVSLGPGASTRVTWEMSVAPADAVFSTWNVSTHAWQTVRGTFNFTVGESSRDHRVSTLFTLK